MIITMQVNKEEAQFPLGIIQRLEKQDLKNGIIEDIQKGCLQVSGDLCLKTNGHILGVLICAWNEKRLFCPRIKGWATGEEAQDISN